jgi:hypothetical protein
MSANSFFQRLRCLWLTSNRAKDSRQIAVNTAHQCLDKVLNRINYDTHSWSAAQLRGYLRATATPWIDLSLEKTLRQHARTGGEMAQVRSLSIDILEQMVEQKLAKQSAALSTKSAAA